MIKLDKICIKKVWFESIGSQNGSLVMFLLGPYSLMRQVLSLILREVDAFDDTGNHIRPSLQSFSGDQFFHGLAKKEVDPPKLKLYQHLLSVRLLLTYMILFMWKTMII